MKLKPCPICGSEPRVEKGSGIQCYGCGLWLGAGSAALDYWRKLRGDPYLKPEDGWVVEVWNSQKRPYKLEAERDKALAEIEKRRKQGRERIRRYRRKKEETT